jgi:hypothetical protein
VQAHVSFAQHTTRIPLGSHVKPRLAFCSRGENRISNRKMWFVSKYNIKIIRTEPYRLRISRDSQIRAHFVVAFRWVHLI